MSSLAINVLLIEDNPGDARLLQEMFQEPGSLKIELTHFGCMSDSLKFLATAEANIIFLDLGLPDASGLEAVRHVRTLAPGIPLVVLTCLDDETMAMQALQEGAQDYLVKDRIESHSVIRSLRYAMERHRMQACADLAGKQQAQFKDEFLSHVSHELRSPLNAIYQFATILTDKLAGELNSDQIEYLGIVLRNVKQLQAMINDLLEVTRLQAGRLPIGRQCTPVAAAIADSINTLQGNAAAKGIALSAIVQPGLPPVCADPARLQQVLIILVDNAIKFTPPNGAVYVQARVHETDPNLVLLEVSDTGRGIEPDMTKRIFERLYQASDPAQAGRIGLGLGLHICKELVTRQGGQIWAKSAPGEGAVFSVTLPVFSLPNLIAPALRNEKPVETPLTLVVTEIGSQTGWLSDAVRVENSHPVRDLLRGCLHSELDVVLPSMGPAGAAELIFIVAVTDEIGAGAITKRILERLNGSAHIRQAGLTVAASYRLIEVAPRGAGESMEAFRDKVAAKIQELMNDEISRRMTLNGQAENSRCG